MSQYELYEHRRYLADDRRTAAYRAALAEVVRPGDVVLDLGAGTGVLGLLACEAGAGSVVAVEQGEIIELARRVAADNGHSDRISHLRERSTEVQMLTPVDVVVCDQIGGLVHDAGVLRFFADAKRRLLAADGVLVPAEFSIFMAPVTFDAGREAVDFWLSKPAGIDSSAAHTHAANTEWQYNISAEEVTALAEGHELATFAADHLDPIRGSARFTVETGGRLDGYLGWFEARLSPTVTVTNDLWSSSRLDRWCNFYPLDRSQQVPPGASVQLDLQIVPKLGIVSWSTTAEVGGGGIHRSEQSTFRGPFMSSDALREATDRRSAPALSRQDAVREILDLAGSGLRSPQVVEAMRPRVGPEFASLDHLDSFVRKVLAIAR